MPDFTMKPTFPIGDVINAATKNAQLQQQAREAGNQSLIEGLKSIGQVGQSLYNQKLQMAQALAGAKMFAQTPEGQQMLGPTTTTTTAQPTVMRNQTAAYDPTTGSVTPNAEMSGVGTLGPPQTTTTSTPSPIKMQDLQTAMYGESPSNMLTQLFERQKQRQQFGLEQQKQAFTEKMEPVKLAQQAQLTQALTGVKASQVSTEAASNIRNQITALEGKKAQAIKDFPELTGTFLKGILPAGSNAKEEAAFNDYQNTQKQIDDYNRQLYGGGAPKNNPAAHMSTADLLAIVNQSK